MAPASLLLQGSGDISGYWDPSVPVLTYELFCGPSHLFLCWVLAESRLGALLSVFCMWGS